MDLALYLVDLMLEVQKVMERDKLVVMEQQTLVAVVLVVLLQILLVLRVLRQVAAVMVDLVLYLSLILLLDK